MHNASDSEAADQAAAPAQRQSYNTVRQRKRKKDMRKARREKRAEEKMMLASLKKGTDAEDEDDSIALTSGGAARAFMSLGSFDSAEGARRHRGGGGEKRLAPAPEELLPWKVQCCNTVLRTASVHRSTSEYHDFPTHAEQHRAMIRPRIPPRPSFDGTNVSAAATTTTTNIGTSDTSNTTTTSNAANMLAAGDSGSSLTHYRTVELSPPANGTREVWRSCFQTGFCA
jgi:hypothetical protein